jgi:hypothetical protein
MQITEAQLIALGRLYRGQNLTRTQQRSLRALADKGIIARTGTGDFMIPYGSIGRSIINAGKA